MQKINHNSLGRHTAAVISIISCMCISLTGCGNTSVKETLRSGTAESLGVSDNEILTYTPIDPDKTQLVVGVVGNLMTESMWTAFGEQNPDIQLISLDITGGNSLEAPYVNWLANGYRPDLMLIAAGSYANINPQLYFQDLTTNDVVDLYQAEALNSLAVDGRLYSLPGPSSIYGLYYNQTMFDQYGWNFPTTMEDFIALCQQIKTDTNGEVQAFNPNAKYELLLIPTLEAFQYTELFGGVDNYTWYADLLAGKASYSDHMQPFFDMFQRLVDGGVITEDHFSYSATTRLNEFKENKTAMVNYTISRKSIDSSASIFGFGTFPCTEGDGYLVSDLSYAVALPVKTQTEQEAEATQRLLSFLSTPEAQHMYINESVMVSSLKNGTDNKNALPELVQQAFDEGHIFNALSLKRSDQPASYTPFASIRSQLLSIAKGEQTAEGAMAALDEEHQSVLDGTFQTDLETVATASEDFTILETSQYFADKYRETTGADVALIANNFSNCGNVMRIFAGDLTTAHVTTLVPRSLGKNTLVKASMTGQQLLDALDHPYILNQKGEGGIYAFSGLKCTVAPWKEPGTRFQTVTLADGTPVDPEKLYTVAYWNGTVDPAYVTGEPEVYEGTFEQLLTDWLKADQTIAPAKDGRITLVWDRS